MKRIKKIASLLLAAVMVFTMSATVFAASPDTTPEPNPAPTEESTAVDTGNFSIKLKDSQGGHTYSAYQIFKGDLLVIDNTITTPIEGADGDDIGLSEDADIKVLSNIQWGDNINQTDLIAKIKAITYEGAPDPTPFAGLADDASAKDVADVLKGLDNDSAALQAFADKIFADCLTGTPKTATTPDAAGIYTITGLTAGYYLVADNGGLATGTPDAHSRFIMQVVADVEATVKTEIPTLEKDILMGSSEQDSNSAAIGDNVTYQLRSFVPDYTGYDYYYFIMNDTMSEGLDFNNDVQITLNSVTRNAQGEITSRVAIANQPVRGTDYTVYNAIDNSTIAANPPTGAPTSVTKDDEGKTRVKIAFHNIMDYEPGLEIIVTYSAKVNDQAVIGEAGNPNEANLTYSNNPNHHYEGDRDNTHPGLPLNVPTEVLGETVEDIVITYLTQLQITKTDEDRQILPGAQFTLTGVSKQTVLKGGDQFVQYGANETVDATNVWYQLTDGSYTNTAPTAQQMVEITEEPEGGYVRGYVVAASTYNENDVITVDGVRYRFYRTGDTDVRVYALQAPNGEAYYSTTTLYKKVSAQSNTVVERLVTLTGTSNDQGLIVFEGIGEGTFTITETITPAGYNTAEPITITTDAKIETTDAHGNIVEVELEEATISEATQQCKWISTSGDADNPNYGAFTVQTAGVNPGSGYLATIINRAGTLLPSTGGIGTTIFYVVGGILVIGAGILLVAKKRMSNRR